MVEWSERKGDRFLIRLNTMRRKPPRLQKNFRRSSVPQTQWCTIENKYKMRECLGVATEFLAIGHWELRVGNRDQTFPNPSLSYCKWSRFPPNSSLSPLLTWSLHSWMLPLYRPSFRRAHFLIWLNWGFLVCAQHSEMRGDALLVVLFVEDKLLSLVIWILAVALNCVAVCQDTSVPSEYRHVARLITRIVGCKTEICCVRADAKPKRWWSTTESFAFDTSIIVFYNRSGQRVLYYLSIVVAHLNAKKARFCCLFWWQFRVYIWPPLRSFRMMHEIHLH